MINVKCRVFESEDTRKYGSTFCDDIDFTSKRYHKREIYKCNQCNSLSIMPVPTQKELSLYYNYYTALSLYYDYAGLRKNCQFMNKRKSLSFIQNLASSIGRGKVLDIGCNCGDILASLPPSLAKFGVDVVAFACKEAEKKGVEVLCSSWESANFNEKFDLVIALDFLEHVEDVSNSLNKISNVLRGGGYVIIETGNADSWAAKILREDWYYTAVFGHLQVLSPQALLDLAKNAQIEMISLTKGNHSTEMFNCILYRAILAYGFHLMRLASSLLKPSIGNLHPIRKLFNRVPPGAILADHMIMIGRKQM